MKAQKKQTELRFGDHTPAVRKSADRLYQSDPRRFRQLVVFLRSAPKQGLSGPAVCEAIDRFHRDFLPSPGPWWPLLLRLAQRAETSLKEAAARRQKEEEAASSGNAIQNLLAAFDRRAGAMKRG